MTTLAWGSHGRLELAGCIRVWLLQHSHINAGKMPTKHMYQTVCRQWSTVAREWRADMGGLEGSRIKKAYIKFLLAFEQHISQEAVVEVRKVFKDISSLLSCFRCHPRCWCFCDCSPVAKLANALPRREAEAVQKERTTILISASTALSCLEMLHWSCKDKPSTGLQPEACFTSWHGGIMHGIDISHCMSAGSRHGPSYGQYGQLTLYNLCSQ